MKIYIATETIKEIMSDTAIIANLSNSPNTYQNETTIEFKLNQPSKDDMVGELQADIWVWSKKHEKILKDEELTFFIQGWKQAKGYIDED